MQGGLTAVSVAGFFGIYYHLSKVQALKKATGDAFSDFKQADDAWGIANTNFQKDFAALQDLQYTNTSLACVIEGYRNFIEDLDSFCSHSSEPKGDAARAKLQIFYKVNIDSAAIRRKFSIEQRSNHLFLATSDYPGAIFGGSGVNSKLNCGKFTNGLHLSVVNTIPCDNAFNDIQNLRLRDIAVNRALVFSRDCVPNFDKPLQYKSTLNIDLHLNSKQPSYTEKIELEHTITDFRETAEKSLAIINSQCKLLNSSMKSFEYYSVLSNKTNLMLSTQAHSLALDASRKKLDAITPVKEAKRQFYDQVFHDQTINMMYGMLYLLIWSMPVAVILLLQSKLSASDNSELEKRQVISMAPSPKNSNYDYKKADEHELQELLPANDLENSRGSKKFKMNRKDII